MRDLRTSDVRKLNGFTREAVVCESLSELIGLFCDRADEIVPCEFANWNAFSSDLTTYQGIYGSRQFHAIADGLRTAFISTLHTHPLTDWLQGNAQHTLALALTGSLAISDLPGSFEDTAVHDEVYRRLDTRDQLTCGLGVAPVGDQAFIIGFNRRRVGFSDRDRQLAEALAHLLQRSAQLVYRLEHAQTYLRELQFLLGRPVGKLTSSEIQILQGLLSGKTQTLMARELRINECVLRRRVALIREKMGYVTTRMMVTELRHTTHLA